MNTKVQTTTTASDSELDLNGCDQIIRTLWHKAAPNLTPAELEQFGGLSDRATTLSGNLSTMLIGVAVLAQSLKPETGEARRERVEYFANADNFASLLYGIAEIVQVIDGLHDVASEVMFHRLHPEYLQLARGKNAAKP